MNTHHILYTAVLLFAFAAPASASVDVSVTVAPPALPVYAQPPCPGDGYIWTPGYWAWAGALLLGSWDLGARA